MGFWSNIFGSRGGNEPTSPPAAPVVVVAADNESDNSAITTFNNKNITYAGELAKYDYDKVLRNKQEFIQDLFQ